MIFIVMRMMVATKVMMMLMMILIISWVRFLVKMLGVSREVMNIMQDMNQRRIEGSQKVYDQYKYSHGE